MKCDRCRKRHATTHLTRIEGGRVHEDHLCESCDRGSPPEEGPAAANEPELGKTPARTCRSRGHVNQENWNFCSACGAMREP